MAPATETIWQKIYRYKVHHVLVWMAYYIFWFSFYSRHYSSSLHLMITTATYLVFNAAAFYTTAYYLFPRYLYKNKYGKFFLSFTVVILLLSAGLAICLYFLFRDYKDAPSDIFIIFQVAFMSISTMVGVLCAIKLLIERIQSLRAARQAEQERLQSELQFLKAQVNPHFLFNAINSIYFLIKKDPDKAADTLIRLSDLLRFQLYDCSDEMIPIEKEIEYLNNFIALESIRKGNKVKVDVAFENLSGFQITPFILMPFLENAFKYVSSHGQQENRISIRVARERDELKASFFNTTDNVPRNGVGGIGLKNVRRRLELIYAHKHNLHINDEPGQYSVNLSLALV